MFTFPFSKAGKIKEALRKTGRYFCTDPQVMTVCKQYPSSMMTVSRYCHHTAYSVGAAWLPMETRR